MNNIIQYNGFYNDSKGTIPIIVENDFKTLACEIDGVKFYGRELSDLAVDDRAKYTSEQLGRFKFYPISIYGTDEVELLLCNCSFSLLVPQIVLDIENYNEVVVNIKVDYSLGKHEQQPMTGHFELEIYELSMTINGKTCCAKSEHMEDGLQILQDQFGYKHVFKNCFGCMYGDYSVSGSSAFGSMMCYANQKEEYLKVTNKGEYMDLETSNCERVQEIYCCEDFEIRKKGIGYRG